MFEKHLDEIVALALAAGAVTLDYFGKSPGVTLKPDTTPVTEADQRAEALILAGLAKLLPGVPVVAEERVAAGHVPILAGPAPFILVDPLDGTREFIAGRDEFTVNIAIIENGVPSLGVVVLPAQQTVYGTDGRSGAWRMVAGSAKATIRCRPMRRDDLVAVASRSHLDPQTKGFIDTLGVRASINSGSSGKFCRIAEGAADVYPRFAPTMEWDTAAGQAVLAAAGGRVTTPAGAPLAYGKPGYRNGPFIAWGAGSLAGLTAPSS
mgnify:CR=1 FL=1